MESYYGTAGTYECSEIPVEHVDAMKYLMKRLHGKCLMCKSFEGKKADRMWIYKADTPSLSTEKGPAMLAIAQYGKCHAVLAPDYLVGKQWVIVNYLMEKVADRPQSYVVFGSDLYHRMFTAGCRLKDVTLYE